MLRLYKLQVTPVILWLIIWSISIAVYFNFQSFQLLNNSFQKIVIQHLYTVAILLFVQIETENKLVSELVFAVILYYSLNYFIFVSRDPLTVLVRTQIFKISLVLVRSGPWFFIFPFWSVDPCWWDEFSINSTSLILTTLPLVVTARI